MYKIFVITNIIATIIFAAIFGHSAANGADVAGLWFWLMMAFAIITTLGIAYDE